MKKYGGIWIMSLLAASMFLTGCDDDEEKDPAPGATEKVYTLSALESSGVSGTVTFTKENASTTRILIQLSGTMDGDSHPAHIHANAASAGGPIVVDLNPVDGATGRSETMVTQMNDGTPVTYDKLVTYNGHVNVHKSTTELSIMIAQGNIGSNAAGSSSTGGNGSGGGGTGSGDPYDYD